MSTLGGCLVCGQVLGKDNGLLCGDCRREGYMTHTGTLARLVRPTDTGPVEVTAADIGAVLGVALREGGSSFELAGEHLIRMLQGPPRLIELPDIEVLIEDGKVVVATAHTLAGAEALIDMPGIPDDVR